MASISFDEEAKISPTRFTSTQGFEPIHQTKAGFDLIKVILLFISDNRALECVRDKNELSDYVH